MKHNANLIFLAGVPTEALHELMNIPLPSKHLKVRPGSKQKDGKKAQVMVYFEKPFAQDELDRRFGAHNWNMTYEMVHNEPTKAACACYLTISLKATPEERAAGKTYRESYARNEIGEGGGMEPAKSAATDSFRRACAALGLGRYIYGKLPYISWDITEAGWFVDMNEPMVMKKFGIEADDASVEQAIDKVLERYAPPTTSKPEDKPKEF
jgi:hypothetical protein